MASAGVKGRAAMVFDLVLIGSAIAVDPLPLTAFFVVLPSQRGVRKGAAFVAGWLVSMGIVVAVTVLATGNSPPRPDTVPSLAGLAVKIAIGVFLVTVAAGHYRAMGRPKPPKKPPKWQAQVDTMSPWFALGLAPALQPWGLIAAGAATVLAARLSSAGSYLVMIVYCVLASSTYLAMEIYAALRPGPCQAFLARARRWIDAHIDQVIIFGSLIVGLWLIANSLYLVIVA